VSGHLVADLLTGRPPFRAIAQMGVARF
jgi:hypothetical protein